MSILEQLIEESEKRERAYAQQVEQAYIHWIQLQGMLAAERVNLAALREAALKELPPKQNNL